MSKAKRTPEYHVLTLQHLKSNGGPKTLQVVFSTDDYALSVNLDEFEFHRRSFNGGGVPDKGAVYMSHTGWYWCGVWIDKFGKRNIVITHQGEAVPLFTDDGSLNVVGIKTLIGINNTDSVSTPPNEKKTRLERLAEAACMSVDECKEVLVKLALKASDERILANLKKK